jgi:elongation factor P
MLEVTELRNGTYFEEGGQPFKVADYEHVKMGRGHAIIKVKVRNLLSGSVTTKSYITGKRVDEAEIEDVRVTFKYRTNTDFVFEDEDGEELELSKTYVGDNSVYLQKDMQVTLALYKGEPLDLTLPIKAVYIVKEAPPDARGNTAGAATKEVLLANNLKIKTPMFIKAGDRIVIDTRTGTYIERA